MSLSIQEKSNRIKQIGMHFYKVMSHSVSEASSKFENESTELILEAELAALGIYVVQVLTVLTVLTNKEKNIELEIFKRAITDTYLFGFDRLSNELTKRIVR